PLSLYLPGLKFWAGGRRPGWTRTAYNGPPRVGELDVVAIAAPRVRLCWWGAACNLAPTKLQSSYTVPGFHELWRRQVLQYSIVRLVSATPLPLTPQQVSHALTLTKLKRDELLIQH